MKRGFLLAMALWASLGSVAAARAQEPQAGTLQLESGWSLEPILLKGAIVGYYGELSKDKAVGQNVTKVWLHVTPEGPWAMYGWGESSTNEAAAAILSYYGPTNLGATFGSTFTAIDAVCPADQAVALRPKNMRAGLLPSDPYAATADNLSADTIQKIIAKGAAGAPELSVLQHTEETCSAEEANQLDARLDAATEQFSQLLGLKPAKAAAARSNKCWFCFPGTYTVWGGWSAWACTGPPTQIAGCAGSGGCKYTGCTRSRTGTNVYVSLGCTGTITGTVTDSQGPQNVTTALPANGICPSHP
jgi:hypothetical protein